MTKEEEYISNELNQNYEVITMSHSFGVLDKTIRKSFLIVEFMTHFTNIYTKGATNTINVWFKTNSEILVKELNEQILKVDFSKKCTQELFDDLVAHFNQPQDKVRFNYSFIKAHFFEYHKKTNINPVLVDIVSNLTNVDDIDEIVDKFKLTEPREITNYINDYLVSGYMDKFVNDKLTDFLRQLVITPGARGWDWKVTWIGHGEVNRDKLRLHFETESETILKLIFAKYKEWFDVETYEASVRCSEKML